MNEWYLSDGTVLTGKERFLYLQDKMRNFNDLSKDIEITLSNCEKLNVVEHDESLAISVLETSERLSLIKLELEMLLEELDRRV